MPTVIMSRKQTTAHTSITIALHPRFLIPMASTRSLALRPTVVLFSLTVSSTNALYRNVAAPAMRTTMMIAGIWILPHR